MRRASSFSIWRLTGNSSNYGGFTVEAGTMVLEGTNTPHVRVGDTHDWSYAGIETSRVAVQSGATFRLSHHARLRGDVDVADGGAFVLNQTVNEASESISGSLRQDMADLGLAAMEGNVSLTGAAAMVVDADSPVATTLVGNISGGTSASFTKTGSGTFVVDGQVSTPIGTVQAGGLVVKDGTNFLSSWSRWSIGEAGFLGVEGISGDSLLACISTSSSGVLALSTDQKTQLATEYHTFLYTGALGTVNYGEQGTSLTLAANSNGEWLLGGGGGTLNVHFRLTGENDLVVGNEYSSGTVHLTNTQNDFSGDIYIKGTGNILTYVDGALGSARVALSYGNTLAVNDAAQVDILKAGAMGVLAATKSQDLDFRGLNVSLGAVGNLVYTGALSVDDKYMLGGSGDLVLDTELNAAAEMEIDGQGTTGSSVTFARKNAYEGSVQAGGGLHLEEVNGSGNVAIYAGHAEALGAVASQNLQKDATLHTDGHTTLVAQNLSAESGIQIRNTGEDASLLQLRVTKGTETHIADDLLARIITLGAGESETLFSGVDALTLIDGTTSFTLNPGELGAGDGVLAETYFSNLSGADYLLTFADNGSGEGAVAITVVPEPAGATLSLLALAALASRQSRK